MSRTYRRKNYEATQGTSWDRRGDKIAGYYTVCEWNYKLHESIEGYSYRQNYTYREPTEHEYGKEYWRVHGDANHSMCWNNPGKWFRNYEQNRQRQHDRRELHEFYTNPDYEVMVYDSYPLPYWD